MTTWSRKRKSIYGMIAAFIVLAGVGLPLFLVFYRAPTCFDGVQNGGESGVDCGGKCTRLCQSSFLAPSVAWTRFEEVAPDLYNVAAYITNPNPEGEALNVPYHMSLYDSKGLIIKDRAGQITIPPHRNTLAFERAIPSGSRVPTRALFEFTGVPNWQKKTDNLNSIGIGAKDYNEDGNSSSLAVTLTNSGIRALANISVYVILYDSDGNVLNFSKTIIDNIPAKGSTVAPFTWPKSHQGKVISIEVLPVAE